jgi:hypothetical protein
MPLIGGGAYPTLEPMTGAGSGAVQEKQRAWLSEIVAKLNDLFEGDLTDQDRLVYMNDVLRGKLLESETLIQQATNNTKEQFANSPGHCQLAGVEPSHSRSVARRCGRASGPRHARVGRGTGLVSLSCWSHELRAPGRYTLAVIPRVGGRYMAQDLTTVRSTWVTITITP